MRPAGPGHLEPITTTTSTEDVRDIARSLFFQTIDTPTEDNKMSTTITRKRSIRVWNDDFQEWQGGWILIKLINDGEKAIVQEDGERVSYVMDLDDIEIER